jgi:hypothetical protein
MRTRPWLLCLPVIALVLAGALPAVAHRITSAKVDDTCTKYTITLKGVDVPHREYAYYNITLTPTIGSPINVQGQILVVPHHGKFRVEQRETWKHFGDTLDGTYTLSGTAYLQTNHTKFPIDFSPATLTCQVNSCLPSSSLGVLVQASKVTFYVPNGAWSTNNTGLQVVPVEGGGSPASVSTPSVVNSCSSNSVTGETVCTANDTDVYLITGSTLNTTLTSGATGFVGFTGGSCETCGVAVNAVADMAVLTVGLSGTTAKRAGSSGIQFLDLSDNTLTTPDPLFYSVSEGILWDQDRGLILSPDEAGIYDLVQTSNSEEFGNSVGGEFDSAAEDCTTGIALSTIEQTDQLYIGDLTQATFNPGSPGTWTTAEQVQTFPEFSGFSSGTAGIAVSPGSHLGIVTGKDGGNQFGVLQLPPTSGSGTPGVVDYAEAALPDTPDGNPWQQGLDPHTIAAYVSPNNDKAYGLMANGDGVPPTYLARIDLQRLLNAPRTQGTHYVDPTYDLIKHGVLVYISTQ